MRVTLVQRRRITPNVSAYSCPRYVKLGSRSNQDRLIAQLASLGTIIWKQIQFLLFFLRFPLGEVFFDFGYFLGAFYLILGHDFGFEAKRFKDSAAAVSVDDNGMIWND